MLEPAPTRPLRARPAVPADAAAIARIYNQGIAERRATFETRPREVEEVRAWFAAPHPIVVVEAGAEVAGFAACSSYRPRDCYRHIAEVSVYVAAGHRRRGGARLALEALAELAREAGLAKLVSRVFVDNAPSRRLLGRLGFREVGVYERHGRLDGVWRDVVIVEKLL